MFLKHLNNYTEITRFRRTLSVDVDVILNNNLKNKKIKNSCFQEGGFFETLHSLQLGYKDYT